MTRSFLVVVGLIFLGYGLACAVDPALPARLAGLQIINGDGFVEMGAMYGGLQIGVGLFCIYAGFHPPLAHATLLLLLLGIGSLASLRGISALRSEEMLSSYTWGALTFESLVTAVTATLLLRNR